MLDLLPHPGRSKKRLHLATIAGVYGDGSPDLITGMISRCSSLGYRLLLRRLPMD